MTLEQAKNLKIGDEVHAAGCKCHTGPRGGKRYDITRYRVTGAPKMWKTKPHRVKVPIKFGMYGPHGYIEEWNLEFFHTPDSCPIKEV